MHELSIAQSLIELVSEHAKNEGASRVQSIHIRLGEQSGFRRALYFCFDQVSKWTICEGAQLFVEDVPLTVFCEHCDDVKKPSSRYNFRCPSCGMPAPKLMTGREMQVIAIELGYGAPQLRDVSVSAVAENKENTMEFN